ncbi:MAG: DUF2178 domain-containing protein [Methanomassiliicoccaceae archaeon]|nr:DUF2178 domain-containing protein [Methanomassiliicoccaceae archaeon]
MSKITLIYSGYLILELFIVFGAAFVIATTISLPMWLGAVCGCTAAFFVVASRKIKSKGEVEDERARSIAHRSAFFAYIIVVPQIFLAGAFLFFVYGGENPGWGYNTGIALLLVGILMVITYSISYITVNRGMQKDG